MQRAELTIKLYSIVLVDKNPVHISSWLNWSIDFDK